ncbi:hypothetical protein MSBRW_1966 [Methanosarcina barkeri str. Wiesmoor]|uniref:Uncharacterized protein n=2 Tax=Methanosarcina barkeri TaxID=2208 RepID=A0A0E3QLU7_METBA|nr:hypothetical protein [Methanosarcina barkeri]AKB51219.1 hypothetical protein MSBRW_1966 [Methanosarcina barkeri str. Wiesmoor]
MSLLTADFQVFEKKLSSVIDSARSLEEIEAWIRSQQGVESVQLADYLMKSNPPQREFFVEFCMQDGSKIKKVINIFELGNQQFKFHELRDE